MKFSVEFHDDIRSSMENVRGYQFEIYRTTIFFMFQSKGKEESTEGYFGNGTKTF